MERKQSRILSLLSGKNVKCDGWNNFADTKKRFKNKLTSLKTNWLLKNFYED